MQITIDAATFHKWALDHGYVRLSDLAEFAKQRRENDATAAQLLGPIKKCSPTYRRTLHVVSVPPADTFTAEVSALEQPEDLKPAEPPLTDKQTIRLLGEVFEHYGNGPEANKVCRALLDKYGATKASEIPPECRAELIRLVNSKTDYATADAFIASLKA